MGKAFDAWMAAPTTDETPYGAEQMIATGALAHCARRLQDQIDTCQMHCEDLPLALQTALAPLLGGFRFHRGLHGNRG